MAIRVCGKSMSHSVSNQNIATKFYKLVRTTQRGQHDIDQILHVEDADFQKPSKLLSVLLGPVVESIVSLTTSLICQLVKYMPTT